MSVDAYSSLADGAFQLLKASGEEMERCSRGVWNGASIDRHLLSDIELAVQRGSAMALLVGYTQSTRMHRSGGGRDVAAVGTGEQAGGVEMEEAQAD